MNTYTHTRAHTHTHAHTHARTHTRTHTYTHTWQFLLCEQFGIFPTSRLARCPQSARLVLLLFTGEQLPSCAHLLLKVCHHRPLPGYSVLWGGLRQPATPAQENFILIICIRADILILKHDLTTGERFVHWTSKVLKKEKQTYFPYKCTMK